MTEMCCSFFAKRIFRSRKRPFDSSDNMEMKNVRHRCVMLRKCESDLSSTSASFSEQDVRKARAYETRNRDWQKHSNLSLEASGVNRIRVRLRRTVQRNVNYNEDVGFSDDGEASNSSTRQAKKRRKHDR